MSQQTPQKRVLFSRTLALVMVGVLSVITILYGDFTLRSQRVEAATSTNSTLNFQARLQTAGGAIVPDGYYNVQFKLYDGGTAGGPAGKGAANAGTNLWTETWYDSNGVTAGNDNRVRVANGYLTANLGSQTAFPGTINWDQNMWITMNIGGIIQTATPTWDGEMNPRLALTGVPYAFRAGQLAAYNSAADLTSTLSIIQPTVGNQTFQLADQGAAGTYTICIQSSAACGFAANTGGTGYIQNQNAIQQVTSNFWLSGTGRADTSLLTPSLDVATAGTLSIGTATATTLNIATNATAHTIALGSGAAVQGITIGSANSTSSLLLQAGTGNVSIQTQGGTLGIGNNAVAQTITIGNGTGATAVNIISGSGNINVGSTGASTASSTTNFGNTNNGTGTQTVNIGSSANVANAVTLEAGNTGKLQIGNSNVAHTIQIGAAGTSTNQAVTLGSTNSGSTLTMQGGSGISLTTNLAGAGVTVKTSTNSVSAFQVQNASGTPLFAVDTSTTATNLITNPGFEVNDTGWALKGAVSPTKARIVAPATAMYYGVASEQITTTANAGQGISWSYALSANSQYTLSAYVRLSAGTATTVILGRQDVSGTDVDCASGTTITATGFTRLTCTFTTGATVTTPNIYIKQTDATARVIYVDAFKLNASSVTSPYWLGKIQLRGAVSTPAVFQNDNDSTTAFQIQNSTSTAVLFNVDTLNNRVAIGQPTASYLLDVGGDVNTSTVYRAGGVSGIFATCAGGQFLQNQVVAGGITTGGVCATAASGSYITLQAGTPGVADNGNLNINGTGIAATFKAATFDLAAAGTLSIGTSALATTVNIATSANAHTIALGNGAAIQGITIGSTNSTSSLLLQAGTGNLQIQSQGGTLGIGNNAVAQTITIGNATGATAVSVLCGTGACGFGNNAIAHTTTIGSATGAAITNIQGGTGGITIGNEGVANNIQIGDANAAVAQTVNVGNNVNVGSTNTVNIGSAIGTSATTVQSGTNNISLTSNGATAGTVVKSNTNSTAAFQIQNASGVPLLSADTTAGNMSLNTYIGGLNINGVANPAIPSLTSAGAGGTLAAGTYYYMLAAVGPTGTHTAAIRSSPASVTTAGSTSTATLSWTAVPNATGYIVYRSTNNATWFKNTLASGTTSIIDNGSTYTWATSGVPQDYSTAGQLALQEDSMLVLDGGVNGTYSGVLRYSSTANNIILGNTNTGGGINLVGDSFTVTDTTGYHNNFTMNNTGATAFQNRTNSTTAFKIQNAGGASIMNIDTVNSQANFSGSLTLTGVLTSTVATGTAPLSVSSTTMVPNLNVQYLNGYTDIQLAENLRSNENLTGGGTVTFDGNNLNWNSRFILIANGNGADYSTAGYFDIAIPTSGTVITGVGGASNVTVGAAGVPLGIWGALYYIMPIGSNNTTLPGNFRIATYTSALQVPSTWVLIAMRNGDNNIVKLGNGTSLRAGQSVTAGTIDNPTFNGKVNVGTVPGLSAYNLEVQNAIRIWGPGTNGSSGRLFFGDNGVANGDGTDPSNPWIGEGPNDSDLLEFSGSAGIWMRTGYVTDPFQYQSEYTETGHFCINNVTCTHALGVTGQGVASSGFATGTPDIAEYITTTPDVGAYDVVAADPNKTEAVVKATSGMKNSVVGVISDGTSGFQMTNAHYGQAFDATNQESDPNAKPMTLAGRIPVHVTNENGVIRPGDYLTASSTPGYAMKATKAGSTVGKALGFYDGTSGNTVLALINISYYDPSDGDHIQASSGSFDTLQAGSASFGSLNVSGATTLSDLTVTGNTSVQGDLAVQGRTSVQTINVNGHIVTSGNAPIITVGDAAGKPKVTGGIADIATAAQITIDGTDTAGTVSLTTGNNSTTAGTLAHLAFAEHFDGAYKIVVSATNGAASKLPVYVTKTSSGFDIVTDDVSATGTQYQFDYIVLGADMATAAP